MVALLLAAYPLSYLHRALASAPAVRHQRRRWRSADACARLPVPAAPTGPAAHARLRPPAAQEDRPGPRLLLAPPPGPRMPERRDAQYAARPRARDARRQRCAGRNGPG